LSGAWGAAQAVRLFLVFAFVYFFSALLRAVTATLAPVFSAELGLGASQLGLLAGTYFVGFAVMQLPLGAALDRHGARRVMLWLLGLAAIGCAAFALARGFVPLLLARALIGVGVSACLMAPLTLYRHLFTPEAQLRANSWMLMTGSLGMLASTLPVQWLMPILGWRGIFGVVAGMLALGWLLVAWWVPGDRASQPARPAAPRSMAGYGAIARHPMFVRLLPMGFFTYGGLIAMQALWVGPWLTSVGQMTPAQASAGLFVVNLAMLVAFLAWGLWMPRLVRRGQSAEGLIARFWPLGCVLLLLLLARGRDAGPLDWALWCVATSVVTLSQPALGQAFEASLAGRALSAYNLVIFAGVFAVQWGIGLAIDLLRSAGWPELAAYRGAYGLLLVACVGSGLWFHLHRERPAP
jgi:predicted MFS family arabinose efflux permease